MALFVHINLKPRTRLNGPPNRQQAQYWRANFLSVKYRSGSYPQDRRIFFRQRRRDPVRPVLLIADGALGTAYRSSQFSR